MPTLSQIKLPVPKSWDEFEAIVTSSINSQNPSSAAKRYGRSGQAQNGVDIYYEDSMTRAVGVQCKCVEDFTFTQLTEEVEKAEGFSPPLENFIIALSLPRDAKLQKQVFKLSLDRAKAQKFRVGLWFWDDVADELAKDPTELARHYPQIFGSVSSPPIRHERIESDIAKRRFDAYQELWSYFHRKFLPERRHPDYDWDDALDDIALDLDVHSKELSELHGRIGATVPTEVAARIAAAAYEAKEGAFEIALTDYASIPHSARTSAKKVNEELSCALEELRKDLESSGVRFGVK